MEKKILEFSRLLRKGGVDVSLPQIETAVKAVAALGLKRYDFYHALRCTLVTEKADLALFDKLFNLYFTSPPCRQETDKNTATSPPQDKEDAKEYQQVKSSQPSGGETGRNRDTPEKQIINDSVVSPMVPPPIKELEFYHLQQPGVTGLEIEAIKHRLTLLGQKLGSKYSRHYRKAKHGRIDMRKTVKSAFAAGGVPLNIKYKVQALRKPELVILCDVSKSVAPFSEFMLQLAYSFQNNFRLVRSFLFVDVVDEVTAYFINESYSQALDNAFTKARFAHTGISDYGSVFALFAGEYCPRISNNSTLIVLGDARNNGYPADKTALDTVRSLVKRLIWLNPQPREQWDKDDSIISTYAPCCDYLFECRNLRQLENIINRDDVFL